MSHFTFVYCSIPVPTAISNASVTTDVPLVRKQGTSKIASPGVNGEQPQVKAEMNVPIENSSIDNVNTLSGTNGTDVTPESSIRNDVESSSEQEMLRRRRLQKFSAQLTAE